MKKIKSLSKKIANKDLLILWQFTLNNLDKIDIIKNQHQFVEMFLIRSMYLKKILKMEKVAEIKKFENDTNNNKTETVNKSQPQREAVNQLKSVEQEEKITSQPEIKNKDQDIQIKNIHDLIELCEKNKELKIKYELENNLRLVSLKDQKIEVSFSSNLEKSFIKEIIFQTFRMDK